MLVAPKQLDTSKDIKMKGGKILLVSGDVLTPSLSFTDDPSTGFYKTSSVALGYAYQGNSILSIGTNGVTSGSFSGSLSGNASTSTKLATPRTLTWSGDASGSLTFDGSANATATLTLANSGVAAGTYSTVTVDAKGRVTGGSKSAYRSSILFAGNFFSPNNTDWVCPNLAPASADPASPSLNVRAFDDTMETGVGFYQYIPPLATTLTLVIKARPTTNPSSSTKSVMRLYHRAIPDGTAMPAWSAPIQLTDLSFPSGVNYYKTFTQTISLASGGWAPGNTYLFELTRFGSSTADTLLGDLLIIEVQAIWS
jgi:hypothetical protein